MEKILELKKLLLIIDSPNREKCLLLLEENLVRFKKSPGSFSKHQAWEGGYIDHLNETIKIAISIYKVTNTERKHPFSISDVILVLFLHDLEKPFKYIEPKEVFGSDYDKEVFIKNFINKYKIILNEEHKNALKYIHGEGVDYSSTERIQSSLAAFCHICDVFSARIWFDFPNQQ